MPEWLRILAIVSLVAAASCAAAIVIHILRGHRQQKRIMNIVWPVTAFWAGPLAVWACLKNERTQSKPFPASVALDTTHSGAGYTLGDAGAELIHFALPFTIAGFTIFGAWAIDYALAFAVGIVFQYFSIVPMRHLPRGKGLLAALKADIFSLTAWQIGMYGWMAIMRFAVFRREIPVNDPVFWFLMQIGMWAGFLTAYPVNWWLIRRGLKEPM